MGYKFNPFTGNFDTTDSPDGVFESVQVNGDINLDDGGTYATTLQLITPTANRTISFPDATGTVGLVGGSSGQLVYNNAGAYAGAPSTSVGATGNITLSLAGAASTPPVSLTGTWFSGGTSTTTKPQLLIEPTGTTSTAWSTSGTGLGVNAPSGFGGNLLDLQVNGSSKLYISSDGNITVDNGGLYYDATTDRLGIGVSAPTQTLESKGTVRISQDAYSRVDIIPTYGGGGTTAVIQQSTTSPRNGGDLALQADERNGTGGNLLFRTGGSSERARIDSSGRLLVGTSSVEQIVYGGTTNAGIAQQSLYGTDSSSLGLFIKTTTTTASIGGTLSLGRSRSTAVGIVSNGDTTGSIQFLGADGTDLKQYTALIKSEVDGTPGANDMPGRLVFSTTADGAVTPTERMRIDSSGRVGIGTTSPSEKLEVVGTIKATDINFTGLATYADNAAALTGGLVAGDVYKTATGELRITV